LLRKAERPRLAFTTSTSVLEPAARLGAYQASKFAVWGLAETLRLELAGEVEVTVVFPSGMMSRHLESSADAQPDHLRREVVSDEDLEVMMASNPTMASAIATPEDAAGPSVEAVLSGQPYVITHGDLTAAIAERDDDLRQAAEAARDR
jgi:NAD(P)-dependent dehydrogenase (short-subunit alcohol dehydrogenase family)